MVAKADEATAVIEPASAAASEAAASACSLGA